MLQQSAQVCAPFRTLTLLLTTKRKKRVPPNSPLGTPSPKSHRPRTTGAPLLPHPQKLADIARSSCLISPDRGRCNSSLCVLLRYCCAPISVYVGPDACLGRPAKTAAHTQKNCSLFVLYALLRRIRIAPHRQTSLFAYSAGATSMLQEQLTFSPRTASPVCKLCTHRYSASPSQRTPRIAVVSC